MEKLFSRLSSLKKRVFPQSIGKRRATEQDNIPFCFFLRRKTLFSLFTISVAPLFSRESCLEKRFAPVASKKKFHRSRMRRKQASERVCERVRECECVRVVFSNGLSGEGIRRANEQGNTLFSFFSCSRKSGRRGKLSLFTLS